MQGSFSYTGIFAFKSVLMILDIISENICAEKHILSKKRAVPFKWFLRPFIIMIDYIRGNLSWFIIGASMV